MKKRLFGVIMGLILTMSPAVCQGSTETAGAAADDTAEAKTRVIITQDGEVDDMNSLLHTLLYANDLDIEGIVQSSSKLHYSGDDQNEPLRWTGTDWMYDFMDAYEEVYPNLAVHDADYPNPEDLRALTVIGNVSMANETETDTDGSELIKASILKEDARPLYITIGGGANTLARALKSIEEEHGNDADWEEQRKFICEKLVILTWGFQDETYKEYISVNWPEIPVVNVANAAICFGYRWKTAEGLTDGAVEKMSSAWMQENLLNGHGALLDRYMTWGDGTYIDGEDEDQQFGTNESMLNSEDWWGKVPYDRYDFLSEGDSPTFLQLLPIGMRSLEDLTYGGWGGVYMIKEYSGNEAVKNYYTAVQKTNTAPWMEAIFNDFAVRADWCVKSSYEEANHEPEISITEDLDQTAAPGDEITLHAEASDPDGDAVAFTWSEFSDADTYEGDAQISGTDSEITFKIPDDAKSGDTIHVLLTGTDDGEHNLSRYQRVIIKVQ